MKNKKLISTLSAVAIAASITPVSAFADVVPTVENTTSGIESTVDGEQTGSVVTTPDGSGDGTSTTEEGVTGETVLNQAVTNAADNTQTTIKLSGDIKLESSLVIPANKNIVLDLYGHKLYTEKAINVIENNGILTVKNGTVAGKNDGGNSKGMAVANLEGATLTVEESNTVLSGRFGIKNNGYVTINNGKIESYNRNAIYNTKTGTVIINGGEVVTSSTSSGLGRAIVGAGGHIEVNGGYIHNEGNEAANKLFYT